MQIDFERSGGFMGLRIAASFVLDELDEADAEEVRSLINASNFFSLPARIESGQGMDQFQYRLTVSRQEAFDPEPVSHTVTMGEASAPPEMQMLLRKLTVLARGQQSR